MSRLAITHPGNPTYPPFLQITSLIVTVISYDHADDLSNPNDSNDPRLSCLDLTDADLQNIPEVVDGTVFMRCGDCVDTTGLEKLCGAVRAITDIILAKLAHIGKCLFRKCYLVFAIYYFCAVFLVFLYLYFI